MNPRFLSVISVAWLLCSAHTPAQSSLKSAYKDIFLVGAAIPQSCHDHPDSAEAKLVRSQFNTVTPENLMKWEGIHPKPGQYEFAAADRYVDFGIKSGMAVIGHTLVWHQQTPNWVFKNQDGSPVTREVLLERMRDHIQTVVGRYKGKIKGWDVVNEALDENGSLRNSSWRSIIGDDFILKAFEFAHAADPQAELYYNDYRIEVPAKRQGAVAIIQSLKKAGIPITGVGIQEHVNLQWPPLQELEDSITTFGKLGVKVMITELDVDVLPGTSRFGDADVARREAADPAFNPYAKKLPDDVQKKLAQRYREIFGVYLKNRQWISRVTFWGIHDGGSWLNGWPIPGRTNHPLLFDRNLQPKPAFEAVIDAARSIRGN